MSRLIPVLSLFFLVFVVDAAYNTTLAQDRIEPDLAELESPLTHRDFDIRNGMGFRLQLNNFGFGVGGEYRRVLTRYTKGLIEFQISSIRDETEQTFQSYWGYSVIPNKYNRVLVFPVMFGLSRRMFAEYLSDDFRLFVQASGGPTPAFVYPYYDHDLYNLGFRPSFEGFTQQNHDVFQGWGDGEFIFGASGQLSIGANVGGDFGNIQSIRIGYFFHYYPQGIQIMEPFRPGLPAQQFFEQFNPELPPGEQAPGVLEPAASKQYFFGTPHITFVFGGMW